MHLQQKMDGVLLRIGKVRSFEGSKYRSGDGAVGVEIRVHYKENKWITMIIIKKRAILSRLMTLRIALFFVNLMKTMVDHLLLSD